MPLSFMLRGPSEDEAGDTPPQRLDGGYALPPKTHNFTLSADLWSDEASRSLKYVLLGNSMLTALDVRGDLGGDWARTLRDILQTDHTIMFLSFHLEADGGLGDEAGRALAEALMRNRSVTSLSIDGGLSDEAGRALAHALRSNRMITYLAVDIGESKEVRFALSGALQVNQTLTALTIDIHTDEDGLALRNIVQRGGTLVSLLVFSNEMSDDVAVTLGEGFKDNRTITSFNFYNNDPDDDHEETIEYILIDALKRSFTVTSSNLAGRDQDLNKILVRNRKLTLQWWHLAWISQKSESVALRLVVNAMSDLGFRCAVFASFLPEGVRYRPVQQPLRNAELEEYAHGESPAGVTQGQELAGTGAHEFASELAGPISVLEAESSVVSGPSSSSHPTTSSGATKVYPEKASLQGLTSLLQDGPLASVATVSHGSGKQCLVCKPNLPSGRGCQAGRTCHKCHGPHTREEVSSGSGAHRQRDFKRAMRRLRSPDIFEKFPGQ
mmetsp:Transcript_3777/g.7520  ORF Transcript_3777/g.7520 Transcript_3777/m.7520 type:complete len:497 (-) Transcript_3777:307-1797(-)